MYPLQFPIQLDKMVLNIGPNLQNFVRTTYGHIMKKSDIRKVYEKRTAKRMIAY